MMGRGFLSYDPQEGFGLAVYTKQGHILCTVPHAATEDETFEKARTTATAALLTHAALKNAWDEIGYASQDMPFFQLHEAQQAAIRQKCADHGHLPVVSQVELARALGISKQAVHSKIKRHIYESVLVNGRPAIPLDVLNQEEREKLEAAK